MSMPNAPQRFHVRPPQPKDWRAAQARRNEDPVQREASRLRNSAAWQRTRELLKAEKPFCCDPLKVHGSVPAWTEEVHHIIPLAERPDLAFEAANLACVCRACHARVDAMERRGEPTAHLFPCAAQPTRGVVESP
jgi:5-methylcytosine-specific restriction endonuclease McrA